MGFSIGDRVIHPKFGPGQITGEEHRELVGGFKHYYVIKVLGTGATAYIPIRKMEELGVRLIMSWGKVAQVLSTLRSVPSALSNDYRERQAGVQEKLGTCLPIPVAQAVRDLTWRRQCKRLTQKDKALLSRGRELLANEMALATDGEIADAQALIDAALRAAAARGFDQLEAVC
jgi:RNA polymerase-interacting CarD/CdnL/TRCF family regulator